MSGPGRRFVISSVVVAMVAAAPAAAIPASEVADALEADRLFVQEGVAELDRAKLTRAITDGGRYDLDLRIAVLADPGDAQALAVEVGNLIEGATILLFTPGGYGVASSEFDPRRLDRALSAVAPVLEAGTPEEAAAALVAALDPSDAGRSLTVIGAGIAGLILVVALGGYVYDRRRRHDRATDPLERRRADLADRIGMMETELAGTAGPTAAARRPDITAAHERASAALERAREALRRPADGYALQQGESDLRAAEAAYRGLRELLG